MVDRALRMEIEGTMKTRVLGLDLGTKTIGIALSDEAGITAQPVKTLKRKGTKADIHELLEFIDSNDVNTIVAGLPVLMNGTIGARAEEVQAFVERLKGYTDLPIVMWDERLSTIAVTRVLIEGDMSRQKRKKVVDKLAAAYILQGYLDSRRPGPQGEVE